MKKYFCYGFSGILIFFSLWAYALPKEGELSVWTNEAIVSAYTFDAAHFLDRQKEISKYFTAKAWINYSKALETSKLRAAVEKNNYTVSAVALLPPTITYVDKAKEWQASMPLLVLYKNKDYQQKQTLDVMITFIPSSKEGIRGLALTSFTTKVATPACRCEQSVRIKTIV